RSPIPWTHPTRNGRQTCASPSTPRPRPDDPPSRRDSMAEIIAISRLVKRYGDHPAVQDVSLSIEEGEIFGLLGPNGAGKTTLLSVMSTLLRPTSGTVTVAGFDTQREAERIKGICGFVPQELALYPTLSARDNLVFFGRIY